MPSSHIMLSAAVPAGTHIQFLLRLMSCPGEILFFSDTVAYLNKSIWL